MNIREFVVEHTKEIGLPIRTIKFCLLELIVRRNRETIVHYSKKSQYEIFTTCTENREEAFAEVFTHPIAFLFCLLLLCDTLRIKSALSVVLGV